MLNSHRWTSDNDGLLITRLHDYQVRAIAWKVDALCEIKFDAHLSLWLGEDVIHVVTGEHFPNCLGDSEAEAIENSLAVAKTIVEASKSRPKQTPVAV